MSIPRSNPSAVAREGSFPERILVTARNQALENRVEEVDVTISLRAAPIYAKAFVTTTKCA